MSTCIACGQHRPERYLDGTSRAALVIDGQVQTCTPKVSNRGGGHRNNALGVTVLTSEPLPANVQTGEPLPKNAATGKGDAMKRLSLMLATATVFALTVVSSALAVTVPSVPVSAYGSSLLTELADAIGQIFPYAAAITAFAIGVGMVRRWLGHRKATQV